MRFLLQVSVLVTGGWLVAAMTSDPAFYSQMPLHPLLRDSSRATPLHGYPLPLRSSTLVAYNPRDRYDTDRPYDVDYTGRRLRYRSGRYDTLDNPTSPYTSSHLDNIYQSEPIRTRASYESPGYIGDQGGNRVSGRYMGLGSRTQRPYYADQRARNYMDDSSLI